MGANNADFHGGNIDFDTWHGKAFKIVTTPSGHATDDKGKILPDDPDRWSIVTPENTEHDYPMDTCTGCNAWEDWKTAPKKHINLARKRWNDILKDPNAKYKVDQIRRSMK
jgi:hypothetical protein